MARGGRAVGGGMRGGSPGKGDGGMGGVRRGRREDGGKRVVPMGEGDLPRELH